MELKLCPECGAPEFITTLHDWLDNGDIVMKSVHKYRLVFVESENIDPLFRGIEQIIGMPIEHLVIAAARRSFRSYLSGIIPEDIKNKILSGELRFEDFNDGGTDIARVMGQGSFTRVALRYERDDDDYTISRVSEPFSLPFACAANAASAEAWTDRDFGVTYKEVGPDEYDLDVFVSPHPAGLRERLRFRPYQHLKGDVELEKCSGCGGPRALSGYEWYVDRGVIVSRSTGRRMAFFGPQMLDPVFDELEAELGETIPQVTVEAQRRFTRSGVYSMDEVNTADDFRTQIALRGLGNLKDIDIRRKGMTMRVENAVLPLMIVGMMQGVFEMAFDVDSHVDWEISEEGNLSLEVVALV